MNKILEERYQFLMNLPSPEHKYTDQEILTIALHDIWDKTVDMPVESLMAKLYPYCVPAIWNTLDATCSERNAEQIEHLINVLYKLAYSRDNLTF